MESVKIQVEDLPNESICDYCRLLQSDGISEDTVVESYRGDVLSLRTTVGWGAEHTVQRGQKFVKYGIPRSGRKRTTEHPF